MTFAKSDFPLTSLSAFHEAPNYSLLFPGNTSLSPILCYSDTASWVTINYNCSMFTEPWRIRYRSSSPCLAVIGNIHLLSPAQLSNNLWSYLQFFINFEIFVTYNWILLWVNFSLKSFSWSLTQTVGKRISLVSSSVRTCTSKMRTVLSLDVNGWKLLFSTACIKPFFKLQTVQPLTCWAPHVTGACIMPPN